MKPYLEKLLNENTVLRGFSHAVDQSQLVWHRDAEHRKITVVEGRGWKFQRDNQLPEILNEGDTVVVKAGEYHRIIKGDTDLVITIMKEGCWKGYTQKGMKKKGKKYVPNCVPISEKKDQNKDGENDFKDVQIARMKASGMSEDEIKKKNPELYEKYINEKKKKYEPDEYQKKKYKARGKRGEDMAKAADLYKKNPDDPRIWNIRKKSEDEERRKMKKDKKKRKSKMKKESLSQKELRLLILETIEEMMIDANPTDDSVDFAEGLSKKTKETLKKKAEKAGYTPGSVNQEYKKGLAAWGSSGSRKGMSQHQWAMARVNSAIRKRNPKWANLKKSKAKKKK